MDKLKNYLSPIARLGKTKYSILFPLTVSLLICILSEVFAVVVAKNPNIVGVYIIWINVAAIIYFAFRDGLRGGIIAAIIPIFYYAYIIYSRNHNGEQLVRSIETTLILGLLFLLLAGVIGWLKQTIDKLIESESNEKRRLQSIMEQLPVGVVITDNKGYVVQVNKKVDTMLGIKFPPGTRIGGDPVLPTYVKGKKFVPSQGPLAQVLAHGKPVLGKEMTVTRKDGKQIHIYTSASPIYSQNGKLIAAASITNDITQQKELENRKDDFVNMASHELKTPITSMKLYIDSLKKRIVQYNDHRATTTLQKIMQQTDRLQELVNDLLDVSRLQTGKLSFTKETFRIDTLVDEIVNDLQGMSSGHEIIKKGNVHVNVYADKFRIYQVLTNMITNAIKYSPDGKKIVVGVKRLDGKVTVSVQDFGIGIEKDQQKKIFERLYQVVDDKEKTFPGFGMGLYISKEIIKRHKGSIWVESVKEKGSTFHFSLPLKK